MLRKWLFSPLLIYLHPLFLTLLVHGTKRSSRVLRPNQVSKSVQILKATCELTLNDKQ